jgi:hypothetical protein
MYARFRRSAAALFRSAGDDLYLTTPGSTGFDRLSGSAVAIWSALSDEPTLAELIDVLAESHGVPPDSIEDQVRAFVIELEERGWIEVVERTS